LHYIYIPDSAEIREQHHRHLLVGASSRVAHAAAHQSSASKADEDHEEPTGDNAETVDDIAQGDKKVVLGNPAVRWVEGTFVSGLLLVGLLGMNLVDVLGCHSRRVQIHDVERCRSTTLAKLSLRNLEVPNGGSACRPCGAQELVRFAVQITKIRGARVCGEQEKRFIESFVRVSATTETCLVTTSNVQQPVLGLGRWLQERLPVAHVKRGDRDSLLLDLLFDDLLDRRNDRSRGWQVRFGLVEPSLNSIRKGDLLLRRSKGWEDNESLNESHGAAELVTMTISALWIEWTV
jgi:hypothetical protein